MHPHLDACLKMVLDATSGGGAECAARRDPKQWSVCEVVEHLQRAYLVEREGEPCVVPVKICSDTALSRKADELRTPTSSCSSSARSVALGASAEGGRTRLEVQGSVRALGLTIIERRRCAELIIAKHRHGP